MTNEEWAFMQTDSYIQIVEQEEKNWNESYQNERKAMLEQMNQYLSTGDTQDHYRLFQMFLDEDFRTRYQYKDEFAHMIVLMNIFQAEIQAGESQTVLSLGRSVKELTIQFRKIKFLLWRIEFHNDLQAKESLLSFLKTNRISSILLQTMIQTVSGKKPEVALDLVDFFLEKQSLKYAFGLLRYLDEMEPGNEMILCMLADLCGSIGKKEEMYRYLSEIKEPGEWAQGVRRKYESE